jgi:hypothetical protein
MTRTQDFDAILVDAMFANGFLYGRCYADRKGRFANGEYIHTSRVLATDGEVHTTRNTRYFVVYASGCNLRPAV